MSGFGRIRVSRVYVNIVWVAEDIIILRVVSIV